MSKIKCEKCGATWDTSQDKACPYCGSLGVEKKEKSQEVNNSGGTTIINNYYGNTPQNERAKSLSKINERGEPVGLSERELKIYYQPRPKVLWLAVLCYVVFVAIIGFIAEEIFDFEEIWLIIATICVIILPVALYLLIVKCLQVRWDKLHKNARKLRESEEKGESIE